MFDRHSNTFKTRHGMSPCGIPGKKRANPTYTTWQSMKDRCLNPNSVTFDRYGGRGITVCERWLHSFENFLADMGERPAGMQLDRIDNDGHYEPRNCRWVTKRDNARNRKSCLFIVIDGKKLTAVEWSDITGVPADVIYNRIRHGWDPVRAATETVDARFSRRRRKTA
jgi:hypothetical protein